MASSKVIALLALVCCSVGLALGGLSKAVTASMSKWEHDVFAADLPKVDNIVAVGDGSFYVTLELPGRQGKVVRLRNDARDSILRGLRRPDGLTLVDNTLYVTEEVENGRIVGIDLDGRSAKVIARLRKPEGIRQRADGSLLVTEDLATGGRLVAVDANGGVTQIITGLKKPEGIDIAADGSVYLAESKTGRILRMGKDGVETVVTGLNRPDQIAVAPDGAIWITEDRNPGRAMRYRDGKLEVVLAGLVKPQGIAIGNDGWVYIAEQGKDRIVRVRPRTRFRLSARAGPGNAGTGFSSDPALTN